MRKSIHFWVLCLVYPLANTQAADRLVNQDLKNDIADLGTLTERLESGFHFFKNCKRHNHES